MNKINNSVDFDEYVDNYESLLKDQLSFFSKDRGYFSEYKVNLTKKYTIIEPKTVLDFGCGIGLSLAFLHKYFPNANLFATDISKKSVDYVRNHFSYVNVLDYNKIGSQKFDLILAINIVEHLSNPQAGIQSISASAKPGAIVIVHMPTISNWLTRLVYAMLYDSDPTHVYRPSGKTVRKLFEAEGFETLRDSYLPHFPAFLTKVWPFHPAYLAVFKKI